VDSANVAGQHYDRQHPGEYSVSTDIIVRRARTTDFDAALPLMQQFFAEEGFATSPQQIAQELPAILGDPESAVFLAWRGTNAIGIATVTTSRGIEFGLSAEMEDLYVLPEMRGLGAGSALIQVVVDWCRSQGCTVIEVVVTPEGQAAHDLNGYYHTRGFQETGRVILLHSLA
jgi:aminoglycoside 6'-N-acetyltransferase I